MLKNAVVQFDSVKGTGEAALKLGNKPYLSGSLSTNAIDITPYATASGAPEDDNTKKPGGWGNDPIDLSPLKLADADLTLKAAGLKYEKFDFGPSSIVVTLKSGKLTADLKQTSLFGGAGGATLVADGSGSVPAVALKANISALSLKPLMNAAAGFDMLEGKGDIVVDIAGSGANLQGLMSSLAGNGKFAFDQGTINGVNLTELGNAAKTALSSKSISLAAFSKDAKTTFNALNANFAMKDGVAVMADLKMNSGSFTVAGGGSLDIGKQKLSLSLFPEFADKKQGLNGYGLPIKLAGGWDGVGLNLDWDWLAKKATSDVKTKVTSEIQDELKKSLGGDLGKLLGTGGTAAPAPAPAADAAPAPAQPADSAAAPAQPPAESPKNAEDRLKKEAQKALGKLFGD
jgi:AsmA protein